MLIPFCSIISSPSMSISVEERHGAAVLLIVGIENPGERGDEDKPFLILSCVVRVAFLRR